MSKVKTVEDLRNRWAELRAISGLEASQVELQEAAVTGDLVARNKLKLHHADGFTWYVPGEPLPQLDQRHRLLSDSHLVTTAARWEANQEFKRLDGYILGGNLPELEARIKHFAAAKERAQQRLVQLESEIKAAQAEAEAAESEHKTAVDELNRFAQAAPN